MEEYRQSLLKKISSKRIAYYLIIAANFVVCFSLFINYSGKLSESKFYEAIFVLDVPVYVALLILTTMYYRRKEEVPLFSAAAFFGLVKYSLLLLFLIATNFSYYFLSDFLGYYFGFSLMLAVILIESILLLPLPRIDLLSKFLLLTWFVFNDLVDYFFGLHVMLPPAVSSSYFLVLNLSLTISVFLMTLSKKISRE